jgi:hypothetical protein
VRSGPSLALLLGLALAASIVVGLLGLWPDLRDNSTGDRRESVRITGARSLDPDTIKEAEKLWEDKVAGAG